MPVFQIQVDGIDETFAVEEDDAERAVRKMIRENISMYPTKHDWDVTVAPPVSAKFKCTVVDIRDIEGGNAFETTVSVERVE